MFKFSNANKELDRQFEAIRFASYAEDPIGSIVDRFSHMSDREKEAFVMALAFEMFTAKKRLEIALGSGGDAA